MKAALALTFQLFSTKSFAPLIKHEQKQDLKKEVIAIFEDYEKQKETKWPALKARL